MLSSTARSASSRKPARRPRARLRVEGLEARDVPAVTIDFDAIAAHGQSGGVGGAVLSNYLAGYGVTLTNLTPGTQALVYDARDVYPTLQPIVPPSPYNVIVQTGSLDPISYDVTFAQLQHTFSLTRPSIRAGVTGIALPGWRADAYDAGGLLLASVGESAQSIFSDISARQFTLNGPGIARVRVSSDSHHFAAFSSVVLDDFVLSDGLRPDVAATALTWNASVDPVDFSYVITGADLPQSTTARLYWSPGPGFDPATATLAYETPVQQAQGQYGPIHVPASAFTPRPTGTTHLALVLDAAGVITESDESNNVLTVAIPNAAPALNSIPAQSVAEGSALSLTATATDPDAGQTLTYTLDSAPPGATIDPASGLFTWTAGDGPASATVTVRVTDNGTPALSDTQIFHITVNNVAPTANVSGPTDAVPGQSLGFTLDATDPSADDQAAGFNYTIDWGDGATSTGTGLSGLQVPHTFTATGTFTVQVTATDKDGGISDAATQDVAIQSVVLEGTTLAVGGTLDDDNITFQSASHGHAVKVLIDGVSQGAFTGVANLLAFGQAGNDNIRVGSAILLPATLIGGDGDDHLVAGAGNTVLLGGNGTDRLHGGPGNDAIDGGAGFLDVLIGGGGNDTITDPDGVGQVAGGAGNDDITISFAPDWNINGSHSLPGGSITGGAGDDVLRVSANNPAMRFDVSGNAGDDRIELSGTWDRVRVYGGIGTDTLRNLGVGLVVPNSIENIE